MKNKEALDNTLQSLKNSDFSVFELGYSCDDEYFDF